jgi:hypothetical protein
MIERDDGSDLNGAGVHGGESARREFLRRTGRVAIAAPAVVLLLSAGSKAAAANVYEVVS